MLFSSFGKCKTRVIFFLGLFLALFQLLAPIYLTGFLDIQFRAIHVAFGLSIAFLYFPFSRKVDKDDQGEGTALLDILLVAALLAANINAFAEALNMYTGVREP